MREREYEERDGGIRKREEGAWRMKGQDGEREGRMGEWEE